MQSAIFQSNTAGLSPAERLDRLAEVAQGLDVSLLLCPELFMSGYAIETDVRRYAEPIDGAFAKRVATIAQQTSTCIVYGYPEDVDGVLYNAAQVIDADGSSIANHRKLVLPPGYEPGCFAEGAGLTLFMLDDITFAVLICYDAEFPEAVRAAAVAGAQAMLVPTALAQQWSAVANRVMPARAFENGVYVLYANHAGSEGSLSFLGHSCIVGPDGQDLVRAGAQETIISAKLDMANVLAAQQRLPYINDLDTLRDHLV